MQKSTGDLEYGSISFLSNMSCLYPTYIRGQAYLAANQGKEAAAEFQKILDHTGIVWNCWTGSLAHLGIARANALLAKSSQGADADLARTRSLAAYKDFLALWKDADPTSPSSSKPKPNTPNYSEPGAHPVSSAHLSEVRPVPTSRLLIRRVHRTCGFRRGSLFG